MRSRGRRPTWPGPAAVVSTPATTELRTAAAQLRPSRARRLWPGRARRLLHGAHPGLAAVLPRLPLADLGQPAADLCRQGHQHRGDRGLTGLETTAGRVATATRPARRSGGYPRLTAATASSAVSVGLRPTRTPARSSAAAFAAAVPLDPEMIAPACPIRLPGGASKPAM